MKVLSFLFEIFIGLVVLFLLFFFSLILPRATHVILDIDFSSPIWQVITLIGLYFIAIPYVIGWYHLLKLSIMRKQQTLSSDEGVHSLAFSKYSFGLISILYTLGLPILFLAADLDDAPGVILFAGLFVLFTATISFISARKEKILKNLISQT